LNTSPTKNEYIASLTAQNCYGGDGEEARILDLLTREEYAVLGPYLPERQNYGCKY